MPKLAFNTDEVAAYADLLAQAASVTKVEARPVVAKGALNIKKDAQRLSSGIAHARNYPRSITYDTGETASSVWAEVGPDKAKKVGGGPYRTPGNLGVFFEFGGPRNAPIPHMRPAAEAEQPRFERAVEALVVKALG